LAARATREAPELEKAWFYLAFAQYKAGKAKEAETSLWQATRVQKDLAEAHFLSVSSSRDTGASLRRPRRLRQR
jgi:hypothetical protein